MLHKNLRHQVEEKLLTSYESMYRIAFTYVKNADDALDIVQDSAYKAIKNAKSVKQEEYIETWIYRIVMNCAVDFLKRNRKEMATENLEELHHMETTDKYMDFDTIRALDVLNEKERAVIILRFFEEKKLDEIAAVLGMNGNTVKSILYRSLQKLKTELEKGDMSYEGLC
ncbi:MAG TPA: RNA polymerase subunit sigma-24 [Lachnospiraceae bacterium]|nr:RNA polymerase subunit sigma-24 [Lachnospiraceae bacterium]